MSENAKNNASYGKSLQSNNITDDYAKQPINLMEVCGTHTMSIARYGMREIMPAGVNLLSGPGCPVCVTSNSTIDYMIEIARQPGVIVCTFGDMMRVPGSRSSLMQPKAEGADVRIVYSPLDALQIAAKEAGLESEAAEKAGSTSGKTDNTKGSASGTTDDTKCSASGKTVVFLGVGFETTTPVSAAIIKRAAAAGLDNFCLFSAHKNMPGALRLIAEDEQVDVDGFILPGHVATITGISQFMFLAEEFGIPGVVSGFKPEEIMTSVQMLCEQISGLRANSTRAKIEAVNSHEQCGKFEAANSPVQCAKIQNAYTYAVNDEGNEQAKALIDEVFYTCDAEWRGLGQIANSGYAIRDEFAQFDASKRFTLNPKPSVEHKGCKCGEILKGKMAPQDCPFFGRTCTPENPIGPCMVSSEGTCAAHFRYYK